MNGMFASARKSCPVLVQTQLFRLKTNQTTPYSGIARTELHLKQTNLALNSMARTPDSNEINAHATETVPNSSGGLPVSVETGLSLIRDALGLAGCSMSSIGYAPSPIACYPPAPVNAPERFRGPSGTQATLLSAVPRDRYLRWMSARKANPSPQGEQPPSQ
jgi:hypothetical protein